MTERELSEKLEALADKVQGVIDELGNSPELLDVVEELRSLSNKKYVQGSVSWKDVQPASKKPTKKFPF